MKSQFSFLIALLCTIWTHILPAQTSTFREAKSTKKVTLNLIYNGEQGWAHETDDGKKAGILVEMMQAFGEYLRASHGINASLNYDFIAYEKWTEFQLKVENGTVNTFGLSHMTITEERKKRFQFSQPFMNNIEVLITNKQLPTLLSINEIASKFQGSSAYCSEGSSNLEYLEEIKKEYFPSMQIKMADSDFDAISQMLNDPKGGFTVVDFFRYLSLYKEGRSVKRQGVADRVEGSFGISMPLASDWKPVFDDFLDGYLKSTAYRKSVGSNLDVSAVRLIEGL